MYLMQFYLKQYDTDTITFPTEWWDRWQYQLQRRGMKHIKSIEVQVISITELLHIAICAHCYITHKEENDF